MIYFSKDISLFSLFLIFYLFVDKRNESFTHIIGRNEQFFEINRSIRLFDKIEYGIDFPDNGMVSSHNGIISIHTCISFMEISCTDAGYISVPSADMQQFRMDFQTLYSENNMNPRILHFLAPVDIRRFIKTCQQFDNYCDFFPVFGCTD